jgi:putative endonuclease
MRLAVYGYVYFLTNTYNKVLYIGVTKNLARRVAEHKAKVNNGFTTKYNCDKLVYFEMYDLVSDAIAREKQLKNWKRNWKNKLINESNPDWNDLSEEVGVNEELIQDVKRIYEEIAGQARNEG